MSVKVIADTSIWIDCLRNESSSAAGLIKECIYEDYLAINGLIKCEILQGCKSKNEYNKVEELLDTAKYLEIDKTCWDYAATISFTLNRKGKTVPMADCLIAAQAIKNELSLITNDSHFSIISKHFSIDLKLKPFK